MLLRALLVALLVACGSKNDPSAGVASGVAATSAAGKVRELTGKVTATRDGETRTLAVGGPVNADDTVDTGADGSVVIELAHNNALWSLEAGIKARVDQSPAWSLDKQAAAKAVEHATSSAGRHADRQAADTQITANEKAKTEPEAPAAAVAPNTGADKPAAKDPLAEPKKPMVTNAPTTTKPDPKPTPACDEVSCVMNGDAPCCARYRKSGGAKGVSPSASDLPDTPDRTSIRDAMQAIMPALRRCGEKSSAKGAIKIQVKFGGDGKVEKAEIKDTFDHSIDQCVLTVAKTATVPRSKIGMAVSFPVTIN